ncbi:DUF3352 domain-containing protein [Candidatus Gracilibacteria bacterium]|nr:DUF3352 domain-containing protein [Candidatus Gracilibacteria bacterium]
MKTQTKVLKKWDLVRKNPIFWIGLVIFCVGLFGIGTFVRKALVGELDKFFTKDAIMTAEMRLNEPTLQRLQQLFPTTDLGTLFSNITQDKFGLDWDEDIQPWIGSNIGFALFDKGDFILAAKYRSRAKAEKFLDRFRLPDETFEIRSVGGGELWIPAYSSNIALGFYKGYVLFSTSEKILSENFLDSEKIADTEKYQAIQRDIPSQWAFNFFIDTEKFAQHFFNTGQYAVQKPVFQAITQALPAAGLAVKLDQEAFTVHSKFLTTEGVFAEREIPHDANQTMPELAQFAPQNVLFFMNGADLYQKYVHTKQFLEGFDPQFSVIFDGVLRGISRQYFGEKFDFEKDLLSRFHGQYAILLDFEDVLSPFVNFTLITGFGGPDMEQNLSELHDVIHFAQTQFLTEKKEVKLPDGSMREELVAVDEATIPIQKKEFDGVTYYTAENAGQGKQFSYTFVEGYFLFSTYEQGIRSMVSAYQGKTGNLAQNEDFRESVLFRYSPSESYGFFNVEKLASALELLSTTENPDNPWISAFRAGIRNFTFARKVFPEAVFWTGTLFLR